MGVEIYKLLIKNITSKLHNGFHYVAQPLSRNYTDIYKNKNSYTILSKTLNSSCLTIPFFCKQIPPHIGFNQQMYKKVKREYRAVLGLLKRSGLPNVQHVQCLHTSTIYCQGKAPNDQQNPNKNNDDKLSSLIIKAFLWMLSGYMLVITLSLIFPTTNEDIDAIHYVSWNEFIHHMLAKGEVELIIVRPDVNVVTIFLYDGAVIKGKKADYKVYHMNIVDSNTFEAKLREAEQHLGLLSQHGGGGVPITYERSSDAAGRLIGSLIVAGVLFALFARFKTIMPPMSMDPFSVLGRAKFTLFDPSTGKGVKFADVAGLHEAKMEVMEFVDYLKRPNYYKNLGAKVPKGALLLGPPGCGKTLLAKAVATESNVPFLSMNGSEFIEMIGGLGAARVRNLFKEGRKLSPCIIYIDEIDAIGKKRSGGSRQFTGADGEGEQTLNQLLVELDGMASKEGVIMLASTNRADVLDKALLRPGRFDRHILIDFPTLSERAEIFEQHLKVIALEKDPKHYSRRLAFLTPRFSGADIANVCNEAALHAARGKNIVVKGMDLEYAVERVVGGTEKRSHAMSLSEKRIVAFHESGHALVGWLLPHTDALLKVTIVPRTNLALGFAQYTPTDQKLYSKEELYERMCMMLGGRAAEAVTFNSITTGAQDDLKKVSHMAYAQVRQYGMNDQVGLVSFIEDEKNTQKRPYSKQLAALIDLEVNKLIASAYQETERILIENKEKLHLMAEALLKKETLNYDDVEALIGPPPHGKKKVIESMEFGLWQPGEDTKDALPTDQDPKHTSEFAI